MRHFLKVEDLSPGEIVSLVESARANKGKHSDELAGGTLGMVFSKPSTRTRVSFTVAAYQLGGHAMFISESELQLGRGETIRDTAKVLSGYLDIVVIRTFQQQDVEELAAASTIPVINGLTDDRHPCQAISDLMTIAEHHDDLSQVKVVYLGDGNNVAVSLMNVCAAAGATFTACTPDDLAPPGWAVAEAQSLARQTGATISLEHEPDQAVRDADILYTDVWFSMGQKRTPDKKQHLEPYRIDSELIELAKPSCHVMHCLPAHRGEEITSEVMDGRRSIVFQQAENRLHAQKELIKKLISDA